MDLNVLSRQVLRAIRGKRGQAIVSKRLGYSFNQVYRWESGRTKILWPEFVSLCRVCRVDLSSVLLRTVGYEGDPKDVSAFIKHLTFGASNEYLQERVGVSRFILSHWYAGRSTPSLFHILMLFEKVRFSTVEFISAIVSPDQVPELKFEREKREVRKQLVIDFPFVEAVLLCFQLEQYKKLKSHKTGFVAKRIGISLDAELEVLERLKSIGSIEYDGFKYSLDENIFEKWDLRGDLHTSRALKTHWIGQALKVVDGLTNVSAENHYGYYVFNVDKKGATEISDAYFEFFQKVINIVELREKNPTEVRVLNVHFFNPGEPKR